MTTHIPFAGALRLAALALLVPFASAFAWSKPDAASVSQVLQEVRAHAADANNEANTLDTFVRTNASWQAWAEQLNHVRHHANELFHDYSRLQKIADRGTPNQREAINRMEPIVREMADSLEKTIISLNDNHRGVILPKFKDRIHSDYVTINKLYGELCKCTEESAG